MNQLTNELDKIDSASAWSIGRFRCPFCGKLFKSDKFDSSLGSLCRNCVENALKKAAYNVDIKSWPAGQFLETLDKSGTVSSRLTVLWRFLEVLKILKFKSPSEVETLRTLLVKNLGFLSNHPLAHKVRQAALEACTQVGESMIPLLIRMCEPHPWQYYANIVATLGLIDHNNPEARTLIEKAAKHPDPEIHKRAEVALSDQNATKLNPFSKLHPKTFPQSKEIRKILEKEQLSIFDLAKIGRAADHYSEKKPHPISIESSLEKQMEVLVGQLYTADVLKKIYGDYLHGELFHETSFNVKGTFSLNKLRKADINRALAKVYAHKDLFSAFFDMLPNHVKDIFCFLVWEGEEQEAKYLEKMFKAKIIGKERSKGYRYGNPIQAIHENFWVFQIRSEYMGWRSGGASYQFYLSIDDRLRRVFKTYLPLPKECDLIPLDAIEKTEFIHENQDNILRNIKLYSSYITQGNLKRSQRSGKLLQSSLKQMAEYCHVKEFYDAEDKKLAYIAITLISHFFQGVRCDIKISPAELLKQLFCDFFQNKHSEGKILYKFLYHLKGGYYEYQYEKREKRVKQSLLKILKNLPSSKWVSIENIEKYAWYRDMDLNVVDTKDYANDLYFYRTVDRHSYAYHERTYIRSEFYKEAVIFSLLKTMMFLFATFGIVDIAYDMPKNPVIRERDSEYLSVFDGLRYIRLTPLGEYIIGVSKKCPVTIEEDTARILLDDKRLIITMEGRDPLKAMIISRIADKMSENCYKVTYNSFLKECATKKDISQKVLLFHEHIAAKPPPVWQEFLDDVLKKINPLIYKNQISVFKLKEHKELISIIARDEVLKSYILKAEDYHILIASDNIPKVRKRLEEFGYFIDNI